MTLSKHNEYAHDNSHVAIEKWYTLVAGFSGKFIKESFTKYGVNDNKTFIDPFVGTGTSVVISMINGVKSCGIDINPFNHIVAKVKTNIDIDLTVLENQITNIENRVKHVKNLRKFVWEEIPTTEIKNHLATIWTKREVDINQYKEIPPNMPHLSNWMSPKVVNDVLFLRDVINKCNAEILYEPVQDLLKVAFGSILLKVSNMQLSGPKIAYRRKKGKRIICSEAPVVDLFLEKTYQMKSDLIACNKSISTYKKPELLLGDAREIDNIVSTKFDISITSPPYLNEVCYIDNTRMELYFLELLKNDDELKGMKQQQIRGNSKYLYKLNREYPDNVPNHLSSFNKILEICSTIEGKWKDRKWGWDHPRLVAEYFIDMSNHLLGMKKVLKKGAKYIIVVGDSAIDKVLVPTDEILADLALDVGFSNAIVEPFRSRGSSRHSVKLRESIITLTL